MKATRQCYHDMKQRCLNQRHQQYKNYGARGITICARWLECFNNFLEDMGEKPIGLTLDRIDNEKGYSPDNCRWATPREQRLNQRSCTILSYQGLSMTVTEWAAKLGLNPVTVFSRLSRGCTTEEALSAGRFLPVHSDNPKHRTAMQERQS